MKRQILVVAIFAGAVGTVVIWLIQTDATVGGVTLREEHRRLWGYLGKPGNPVSAWCVEKIRAYDRKRGTLSENSLNFDGASMCWGYSSPTSAWFAFGNTLMGSN